MSESDIKSTSTSPSAAPWPKIFLLSTHLKPDELHRLEDRIPTLTYDATETSFIVGNISRRQRAMFELRRVKVETVPAEDAPYSPDSSRSTKRRKLSPGLLSEPTATDSDDGDCRSQNENIVRVLKLAWLEDSLEKGIALPVNNYVVYTGRRITPQVKNVPQRSQASKKDAQGILQRATADRPPAKHTPAAFSEHKQSQTHHRPRSSHAPPTLQPESTAEHDVALPEIPDYLHTTYSCQRPTPVNPPNLRFVEELKKIRTLRLLQGDQIGVRAYSTSIATLSAYPHALVGSQDVARLPGCGPKIAVLYQQWTGEGQLREVAEAKEDERLKVLQLFYDIWGVGDTTARDFFKKGWRDLDDLVEYGWSSLSRVQQIGVKYYEEFLLKISRKEVESISSTILEHALQIAPGFQMTVVGGYRRGKTESGDVDVVLSHPDESQTLHLIEALVARLERAGYIPHTLTLSAKNSERGQKPLPWKGEGARGSGFDTLDKALVVWQDPVAQKQGADAPHRRVDIIISPWKTVGCAVVGWSGGTTFQRDLRRYCKAERGLKFDSSGIRSRADGSWVDIEGWGSPLAEDAADGKGATAGVAAAASSGDGNGHVSTGRQHGGRVGSPELGTRRRAAPRPHRGPAPDMETAERRVFEGLGLPWRPPEERCTG